jgi:hypothetical protein
MAMNPVAARRSRSLSDRPTGTPNHLPPDAAVELSPEEDMGREGLVKIRVSLAIVG